MTKKIMVIAMSFLFFACEAQVETEKTITSENTNTQVAEKVESLQQMEKMRIKNYDQEIESFCTEKGWDAKPTGSGLYVVIEESGTNGRPTLDQSVTIFYKGYLLDGTVFDATENTPATFPLNRLIAGWQEGIPYFGKGGKGKLIVPPSLGYGNNDSGPIPGKSILVFEIELVNFN